MGIRKMTLETEDFTDFIILALFTRLEDDVSFIYQLNKYLNTRFMRVNDLDIIFEGQEVLYTVYEYIDEKNETQYQIIKNKPINNPATMDKKSELENLFMIHPFLINSHKKFNYLLKLDQSEGNDKFLTQIRTSPLISLSKEITNPKELQNLVF